MQHRLAVAFRRVTGIGKGGKMLGRHHQNHRTRKIGNIGGFVRCASATTASRKPLKFKNLTKMLMFEGPGVI
ncbi:MAG: hypothetical protein V3R37_08360 [Rhodospirillales bacterium]